MFFRSYRLNPLYWLKSKKADRAFIDLLWTVLKIGPSKLPQFKKTVIRQHILSQYFLVNKNETKRIIDLLKLCGITFTMRRKTDDIILMEISRGDSVISIECTGFTKFFIKVNDSAINDIIIAELSELNRLVSLGTIISELERMTLSKYLSSIFSVYDRNDGATITDKYASRLVTILNAGMDMTADTDGWLLHIAGKPIRIKTYK